MNATLGVFMSNYNDSKTIGKAIDAIMTQSRPPDRFHIIDDGSTDDSVSIIQQYQTKYPIITLKRHNVNMGCVASINDVWPSLDTDFIYGASANDTILPGFFEKAMKMARGHENTGVILGNTSSVDENGNNIRIHKIKKWSTSRFSSPQQYLKDCLKSEPPSFSLSSATIYRRKALVEIGGFEKELGPWCDTFATQVLGLTYGVCYITQICSACQETNDSYSGKIRSDLKKHISNINTAIKFMRSDRYHTIFSKKYVYTWYGRYLFYIFANYIFDNIRQILFYLKCFPKTLVSYR